jgi:holo-[acyl-carrier protein] synthase
MIVGFGIDIMKTERIRKVIERHGAGFLGRVYTDHERLYAERKLVGSDQVYAAFWAVKEAVMKALGTGMRQGVFFRDIEVRHERSGKPYVRLSGASKERAAALGADSIVVSMSHLEDLVVAAAVFENTGERTLR